MSIIIENPIYTVLTLIGFVVFSYLCAFHNRKTHFFPWSGSNNPNMNLVAAVYTLTLCISSVIFLLNKQWGENHASKIQSPFLFKFLFLRWFSIFILTIVLCSIEFSFNYLLSGIGGTLFFMIISVFFTE